jgi:hypothetical protein
LSAAARARSRLASRNASHFGATSLSRIPVPDKNNGKDELALVRENRAVIRELQRMQKEPGHVSAWAPKTAPVADAAVPGTAVPAQRMRMRQALQRPKKF